MKKAVYILSCKSGQSAAELNSALLTTVSAELTAGICSQFTINVFDAAVEQSASLRLQRQDPVIEAAVFVWYDDDAVLAEVELTIKPHADILSGYLLQEYSQIPASPELQAQQQLNGTRTPGFMQLAFLKVPERLEYDEWLTIWRESHTQVAIDTQSTFIYRQNVVQACFAGNDLGHSAIVEEGFPAAAMTSQHAFYAADSDEQLRERQITMWNSSKRFIDLPDLDVLPASEYCW